jgi:hypothetical protein
MIVRICGFVSGYGGDGKSQAPDGIAVIPIDTRLVKNVEGCEQALHPGRTGLRESYQRPRLFKP